MELLQAIFKGIAALIVIAIFAGIGLLTFVLIHGIWFAFIGVGVVILAGAAIVGYFSKTEEL